MPLYMKRDEVWVRLDDQLDADVHLCNYDAISQRLGPSIGCIYGIKHARGTLQYSVRIAWNHGAVHHAMLQFPGEAPCEVREEARISF
jgi:hypothetical protein